MEMILEEHADEVALPGIYLFLTESFCHWSVLLSMVWLVFVCISNGFCLILSLSRYIYIYIYIYIVAFVLICFYLPIFSFL